MQVCSKCGADVPEDEVTVVNGEVLCDDCSLLLSMQRTVTPCDNVSGLKFATGAPSEELTKRQQEILGYLKEKKTVRKDSLAKQFSAAESELDEELTVLKSKHMCKTANDEDGVCYVMWDAE
ncbi:MAG: hypothetical protein ACC608_02695 [Anaerofustis sp.]|jgi:DNA-directed RNA polymerase subunit RPC12/RpoP